MINKYKINYRSFDKKAPLYLDIVKRVSLESYCRRLQVGAIIINDGNIISFGYNGKISGAENTCEECLPKEYWKNTNYENYQVSNLGRVKRKELKIDKVFKNKRDNIQTQSINLPEYILEGSIDKKGYPVVNIKKEKIKIHQLVAKSFIENPDSTFYNQINHIDGNKNNNNVNNLEWCTNRYNCEDRSLRNKNEESLPLGIYKTEVGRKQPYVARIYSKGRIESKRVYSIEEGLKFVEFFKDPKEYKTFRYDVKNDLVTLPTVLHAESNAIMKASKSPISTKESTMYCTHSCCIECAKLIIQSGITTFVYLEDYRDMKGIELLLSSDVYVIKANDQNSDISIEILNKSK
jgi:deoxycytidylate deaminase